jgi:hypothetical protein
VRGAAANEAAAAPLRWNGQRSPSSANFGLTLVSNARPRRTKRDYACIEAAACKLLMQLRTAMGRIGA